ncbi:MULTISPECIES: hypothetical protein [Legionella]|uniref:hypothetical protein n=1 Tax=Legionella TaxID=445 RepID=UPI0012ED50E3|nr:MULTISPECIES: hypothetical protein [Legionella]MCE3046184.1 hypothetical protein [Legionella sp. 16cNR16C]MCW8450281.1 hypothetical protein [Legionella quinlivanii]
MKKIVSAVIIATAAVLVSGCGFNNCGGGCANYSAVQYTTTSGCCGYTTSCCTSASW